MKKISNFCDLQVHSLHSDGAFTPTELVGILKKHNIKVAALTDHDTVQGIGEFLTACRRAKIKGIVGTEIYVTYQGHHLHLLGYNFDYTNTALNESFVEIHQRKYKILKKIAPLLKKRGIIVKPEALAGEKAQYISFNGVLRHLESFPQNIARIRKDLGRPHYEHWEIYNRYFKKGLHTHYPEVYIPMEKAMWLIKNAGGQAVLSHPGQQLHFEDDHIILQLKKIGLDGIECFSSHHSYSQIVHYLRLAEQYGLLATGGSDFHNILVNQNLPIDSILDYYSIPSQLYRNIKIF
ncbi:MAG: hypothetical protein C3F02_01965 [Parcubacteria group bacterium]|nr:MAG: hypothetical protein C3F02_01965 [Parcubacteria group bacterium]